MKRILSPTPPAMMFQVSAAALLIIMVAGPVSAAETGALNVEDSHSKIEAAVRVMIDKPDGALTDNDYQAVRYLDISGLGLSDIDPLRRMTSLRTLLMSDNSIRDLSPLGGLPLGKLAFHNNQVDDISVFRTLKGLKIIYFRNNRVKDVSPLLELELKRAVLSGNPVDNADIPAKWKDKLRYKSLSEAESVAAIEKVLREKSRKGSGEITEADCDSVTTLSLSAMGLSDISVLSKCRNLTSLNLHMNEVTDVSPLARMTRLTMLNLGSNNIRDISAFKDLVNLKTLIIYMNDIEDIFVVANMKGLGFLSAYENNISVVKHVYHMKTARRIKFHDNPVPLKAQEECHSHVPDIELMFKVNDKPNYYMPRKK